MFVFSVGSGKDVIVGIGADDGDLILLGPGLTGPSISADEVAEEYGTVIDGDLVLNFGKGNTLTLQNFTNMDALAEMIDFA